PAAVHGNHGYAPAREVELDPRRARRPHAEPHRRSPLKGPLGPWRSSSTTGKRIVSAASVVAPPSTSSPVNRLRHRPAGSATASSSPLSRGTAVTSPASRS